MLGREGRQLALPPPRPSGGSQGRGVSSRWEAARFGRRGRDRENLGDAGVPGAARPDQVTNVSRSKAAGEALPPSKLLTGPASLGRSVCALGAIDFSRNLALP